MIIKYYLACCRCVQEYEDKRQQFKNEKMQKDQLSERLKVARAQHAPLMKRREDAITREKSLNAQMARKVVNLDIKPHNHLC